MSSELIRSSETVLSINDAYFKAKKTPINSLDGYLNFEPRCDEAGARARIEKIKASAVELFNKYALNDRYNQEAVEAVIQEEYSLYVDLFNLIQHGKLLAPDVIRKLIFSGPSKTIENLATEIPIAQALTHQFVSIARSGGIPANTAIVRNKIDTLAQQAIQMPFAAPYGQKKLTNPEFFAMRRESIKILTEIGLLDCQFKAADAIVARTIFGPIAKPKDGPSSSAALGDGSDPFAEPEATPVPAAQGVYVQGETAGRKEEDEKNPFGADDLAAREYAVSREPSPDPFQTVSAAVQDPFEDRDSPPPYPPPSPPHSPSPDPFQAERIASGVPAAPIALRNLMAYSGRPLPLPPASQSVPRPVEQPPVADAAGEAVSATRPRAVSVRSPFRASSPHPSHPAAIPVAFTSHSVIGAVVPAAKPSPRIISKPSISGDKPKTRTQIVKEAFWKLGKNAGDGFSTHSYVYLTLIVASLSFVAGYLNSNPAAAGNGYAGKYI